VSPGECTTPPVGRIRSKDGDHGKAESIMESELSGDQYRLLRAFNDLAGGSPMADVTVSDAAQEAEFDPGSPEFDAALDYLVDVGYLTPTESGEGTFRITVAGINEVQRRTQLPDQTS
jgi:hypothetical protein